MVRHYVKRSRTYELLEGRATEYSKASTQGSWVDAFS